MDEKSVMDVLVLMKRTGNLLNEVEDMTRQIAQCVDRNDQVSLEMLVAMREEPLQNLQATDQALRDQLAGLPNRETAAKLAGMLNSGIPAEESQISLTLRLHFPNLTCTFRWQV